MEHRFYLRELPGIDPEWTLLAGEIIFDLRSALDHLAYQLHVRRYRGRRDAKFERVSQFPIFHDAALYSQFGERKISLLSKRDQRAVKHLQPYETRHDRWFYLRMALGELETVHNIDKHRKLHVVTGSNRARFVIDAMPGLRTKPIWGAVKSHSHVETWTFSEPPATAPDHGGAFLTVAIEYGDGSPSLIPFLQGLTRGVRETIGRFAGRF
jgi:hypothetical protein